MSQEQMKISLFGAEVLGTQSASPARVSQMSIQFLRSAAFNFVGTGGISLGGAAKVNDAFRIVGSGGIVADGKALCRISTRHNLTGNFTAVGSAGFSVSTTIIPVGGVSVSGTPEISATLKQNVSGGVATTGIALVDWFKHRFYAMDNGEVYIDRDTFTADRGVNVSGSYILNLSPIRIQVGGTTDVSGHAIAKIALGFVGSGGINLSGQAKISSVYSVAATGGVTVGSSAVVGYNVTQTAVGGISTGGQGLISGINLIARGMGEVAISGTAPFRISRNYCVKPYPILMGGSYTSQAETNPASFSVVGSGGVTLAGSALLSVLYIIHTNRPETSDGISLLSVDEEGGLGGSALVTIAVGFTSDGELEVGGSSRVGLSLNFNGSGDVVIDGNALSLLTIPYVASGGISVSGTPNLYRTIAYVPTYPYNRVYVFGNAICGLSSHEFIGNGEIHLRGTASVSVQSCDSPCNERIPYYRGYEENPGCVYRYNDGSGSVRKNIKCVRMMDVLPQDANRRFGKVQSAKVAAVTVCQSKLFDTGRPEKICSSKTPK